MDSILLKDLLRFSEDELPDVKIKFNQHDGQDDPMELYRNNPEIVNTQWLFWNKQQRYFRVGQIAVCLLKLSYSQDMWLLTTIKRVTKDLQISGGISFEGEELKRYSLSLAELSLGITKQAHPKEYTSPSCRTN